MPESQRSELTLAFQAVEMDILQQATTDAGMDDVTAWAKETLIRHAQESMEKARPQIDWGIKVEPVAPVAQCACGATKARNGECDGSCVMRF